ncbi:5-oxoprolinase subunit PxpB [Marinicella sp. W31]|uniref:5-oxoprolinase subunit PxpB n=1 Tax=Marinicella sp. W31 TaxID=3023713 RepID=UPI003757035D
MSEAFSVRMNGDCSLLIDIQAECFPTETYLSDIAHALAETLRQHNLPGILEVVPTSAALMLVFDEPVRLSHPHCEAILSVLQTLDRQVLLQQPASRLLSIPVCYELPHAVDLHTVAERTQLSTDEIIERHQAAQFSVDMLGFLPGFAYLRGLPEQLQLPRKATPVLHVSKGSIAIAADYCGLYPQDSPGGWYVIGRTPLRLFDYRKAQPAYLQPGDQVRFSAIDSDQFETLFNTEYADVIDCC